MEIAPVLTELGTTVAVLALFGWLVWKILTPFISRLMDNLDKMSTGYVGYVEAQLKVASAMEAVCDRLNGIESRDEDAAKERAEIVKALQELSGVARGLQQQMLTHEGRAQKRHDQALAHAEERHAEQIAVLKHLNGSK